MAGRWILALSMSFMLFGANAAAEEYARVARLAFIEGHVKFQHPGEVDWTEASTNLALRPGDRIYTGADGRAEIEFDEGSVLRMAEKTDVELTSMSEDQLQIRVLLGLCTLTTRSDAPFAVVTPAAAFRTLREGVYRIDVTETGASDGIVRKGRMEATAADLKQRLDAGELIHVEPGAKPTHVLSRYETRDEWDEWTDRRTADLVAYQSRRYLPDYVYAGASDLDRYGRWVEVDTYGSAWVPLYVDAGWSPYWNGRWCYRPLWGWTWVSYDPWGWLPYHYGRWHFSSGFGWCWLPGPSYGFHFWSPGLVRFYHGPSWVSWVPLGPGDYYNVNHYYYSQRNSHHLNKMRLAQHRGPEDLANRHVPGAFRTSPTDQFVNGGGRGARANSLADVSQQGRGGRMITDRLPVSPTADSFLPVADRAGTAGTTAIGGRPVDRNGPAAGISSGGVMRQGIDPGGISNRRGMGREEPGNPGVLGGSAQGNASIDQPSVERNSVRRSPAAQAPRVWNRIDAAPQGVDRSEAGTGFGSSERMVNPRSYGRNVPGGGGLGPSDPGARAYEAPRPAIIERNPIHEGSQNRPDASGAGSETRYGIGRGISGPRSVTSYQRYDGSGASGSRTWSSEPSVRPPSPSPQSAPAPSRPQAPFYNPAPRSGIERAPDMGRWPGFGGSRDSGFSRPAWGGARGPSSAPSIIHSPSPMGRGPAPGMSPQGGPSPRSAPSGGNPGILRGRNNR